MTAEHARVKGYDELLSRNESIHIGAAWPKGSGETKGDRLCPTVFRGWLCLSLLA